ncbi:MAG: hypothetical protein ABIY47_06565 [Opitutaceae bacterium]
MKTNLVFHLLMLPALAPVVGVSIASSYAGPDPQYWNRTTVNDAEAFQPDNALITRCDSCNTARCPGLNATDENEVSPVFTTRASPSSL